MNDFDIDKNKMRIFAVANQKGGCGKTTSSVNLAASFAAIGKRVLLVDLDPQGHATIGVGYEPNSLEKTIYDVLSQKCDIREVIHKTSIENLDVVGSNILLSGVEFELATRKEREYVLRGALRQTTYDIVVIDCSPSLCLLTLNALVAATEVVIPVQTHYYALEGLKQLLETISIVKQRFNPMLKIGGILLTFVESRTLLSRQVQRQMRQYFGDLVCDTVIHRTVRLAEAPSAGEPVLKYAPRSKGAEEYKALAEEIFYGKTESRITQGCVSHI